MIPSKKPKAPKAPRPPLPPVVLKTFEKEEVRYNPYFEYYTTVSLSFAEVTEWFNKLKKEQYPGHDLEIRIKPYKNSYLDTTYTYRIVGIFTRTIEISPELEELQKAKQEEYKKLKAEYEHERKVYDTEYKKFKKEETLWKIEQLKKKL